VASPFLKSVGKTNALIAEYQLELSCLYGGLLYSLRKVVIFSRPSRAVGTNVMVAKGDFMTPQSYGVALALTILTMLCWGSWANVLKIARGWRFELLYYDYSIGVALCALVAGLTFGTWGSPDHLRFAADLAHAGNMNILSGFAAGVIFNLSNILLVGAISVAGMGVAFPIGVGLALVVGVIWSYTVNPQGNPWLLCLGVVLIVAAILVDAIAYRAHAIKRSDGGDKADAAAKRAETRKGIWLSIVAGVLMGTFYPLVEIGKSGEKGLGPYAVAFVFGLGVLVSVFFYNLYFLKFPIAGPRLKFADYLKGSSWLHFLGIAGGVMWMIGSLSNFVAASVVGPAISYALGQGSTMVGALWGVLVWREFAGGGNRVNWLLALMFVLFITGLGVVSIARS
jgi:glucose uptake protein